MNIKRFLKAAAVCSMLGGITTLVLFLLKVPPAESFDDKILLAENSIYLSRVWLFFFHPQLNIIAVLGLSVLLFRKKPGLVAVGTLFFLVWGITESAQQAFTIDAVNQYWRAGYATEKDAAVKTAYFAQLIGADAIRDSMYFLLVYCFGIGSTLLGFAVFGEDKLATVVGIGLVLWGAISIATFVHYYAGVKILAVPMDFAFTWLYPLTQPAFRFLLGIWLWKQSRQPVLN